MNDKYLRLQLEDLMVDDDFVNWVLDNKKDHLWQAWLTVHQEKRPLILEAKETISQLRFEEANAHEVLLAKKKTWQKIELSTEPKEISLNPSRRKWFVGVAAAASIALLSIFFLSEKGIVVSTQIADAEQISLPANSVVNLSEQSSLTYKKNNWSKRRDVLLEGQAHFEVTKGVPFTVTTDNGSVQVLGTEFDVVSVGSTFQVKVTEGRVNARSGNHQKILTAGMSFYKNPQWSGETAINSKWNSEEILFIFNQQPLNNALKAITFYSGMTIDENAVDISQSYTGSFDTSSGLELALQTVLWPMAIDFEVDSNEIKLRPRE